MPAAAVDVAVGEAQQHTVVEMPSVAAGFAVEDGERHPTDSEMPSAVSEVLVEEEAQQEAAAEMKRSRPVLTSAPKRKALLQNSGGKRARCSRTPWQHRRDLLVYMNMRRRQERR